MTNTDKAAAENPAGLQKGDLFSITIPGMPGLAMAIGSQIFEAMEICWPFVAAKSLFKSGVSRAGAVVPLNLSVLQATKVTAEFAAAVNMDRPGYDGPGCEHRRDSARLRRALRALVYAVDQQTDATGKCTVDVSDRMADAKSLLNELTPSGGDEPDGE